jgi:DeoR/GlpR family transcriptional regulator of sugar metabolism
LIVIRNNIKEFENKRKFDIFRYKLISILKMQDRRKKILELLADKGALSVGELSILLKVSEVTIRSDLKILGEEGRIERSHGGASIIEERLRQEYSFQVRQNQNSEKKYKIGEYAASLVSPFDSIVMDASSTVLTMAKALRNRKDIEDVTVIPTGVWTAVELMSCNKINTLLPSGYLRGISGTIYSSSTNEFFKNIKIQKAFLGASGISVNDGAMDTHLLEIELKRHITEIAAEVILLIDGSKFGQTGLASFAGLKNISKIITDNSAPSKLIKAFKSAGVEIIVVNKRR